MTDAYPDALVSTDWLKQHITAPDVRVIDASSFLPTTPRDAKAEYRECHIPGAVFFDIDDIADTSSDLPHMVAGPDQVFRQGAETGAGRRQHTGGL